MTGLVAADDYPVVGVIGGGQLARMMQPAAIALGVDLRLLAASPTDSAARVIRDVRIGSHSDPEAVRSFAAGCDVVTFDHEHVPAAILSELTDAGITVRPGPAALVHAQDKTTMRAALERAGLPCPKWQILEPDAARDATRQVARAELAEFGELAGWPIVLKTSRGGYDGRGVWIAEDLAAAQRVVSENKLVAGARWLLEERVEFQRELAAQVARSPHGQAVAYPIVETIQTDGMCTEVLSPAPDLDDDVAIEAQRIALEVAATLGVCGMLTVEMFVDGDRLLINELAMRPHNAGHWTIEGSVTSQFENHLRAVLDLPLGSPTMVVPHAVMVNVVGTDRGQLYSAYRHVLARDPRLKVHMYGKSPRLGRKLGHVTAVGNDLAELRERAHPGADYLSGAINE